MKPIVFLRSARRDWREEVAYHEGIDPLLAERFSAAVEFASRAIARFPLAMQIIEREIRRWPVPGFQHGILYRVEDGQIVIVSIFHPRRDPSIWLRRIPS